MGTVLIGIATVAVFASGVGFAQWQRMAADAALEPTAVADGAERKLELAAPFTLGDFEKDAKDLGVSRVGYGPGCQIDCARLETTAGAASPDAAPFDLLTLSFSEQADAVAFELEVARLTEGFPELATTAPVRRIAEYTICWMPSSDDSRRCVLIDMAPAGDRTSIAASLHVRGAESCNDLGWCNFRVPVEVVYGEPGLLRVSVAKEMLSADGAPLAIGSLEATSGWTSTNGAIPLWHAAWTVHANGDHDHAHAGILEPANVADTLAAPHAPVALTAPPVIDPTWAREEPLMMPGVGNLAGGGGLHDEPELDLVAFDLVQEGDTVVATFQMADFDAMPAYDIQFAAIFGVRGGTTYELGLMQANGKPYGYAGRCISFGCHDGYLVQLPFEARDDAIEVRVPRALWPTLLDGDVVDHMIAYTMFGEANVDLGTPGAPIYGNVHTGSVVDIAFGGLPYAFPPSSGDAATAPHHH